jgi:hydrogenase expression/formation protein HypC
MGIEGTKTQHSLAWESVACTLDHDGCVVCSDAGIPLRIVELQGEDALCEDSAGNQTMIAIELVAPVAAGDIVLTHGGVAIGRADLLYETGEDSREVRQ